MEGPAHAAAVKQQALWNVLNNSQSSIEGATWPASAAVIENVCSMDYTDYLNNTQDWKEATDSKILCSNGVVCCVRIELYSDNLAYTGLFRKAQYGIMRLACALSPNVSGTLFKDSAMFPCCSLKFFRGSSSWSGNLLFGGKKTGQPEDFFFARSVCNHLTEKTSVLLHWALAIFRRYSAYPCQLGSSDFAKYDEDGEEVEHPVFPWCLNLFPLLKEEDFPSRVQSSSRDQDETHAHQPQSHNQVEKASPGIFSWFGSAGSSSNRPTPTAKSRGASELQHLHELVEIPAGTAVYELQALRDPSAAREESGSGIERVGRIVTTSPCIFSRRDVKMFFKHQKMEEDLEVRLEWRSALTDYHRNIGSSFFDRAERGKKV